MGLEGRLEPRLNGLHLLLGRLQLCLRRKTSLLVGTFLGWRFFGVVFLGGDSTFFGGDFFGW